MTKKSDIGNIGEDLACDYLKQNGYTIIDRNFRKPWGELDIIAKAKDKTLVIVEVKTLKSLYQNLNFGNPKQNLINNAAILNKTGSMRQLNPEDNLTRAKLKKLQKTAMLYAGSNSRLVSDKKGWRIDLIAINILTDLDNHVLDNSFRHYENII
jgi:putative endonuclease